jgi:hypothetical protein
MQTEEVFPTTTSKRSQPSTSSSDLEEVLWIPPSLPLLKNSTATRRYAENAMPLFPSRLPTAERESADTATNLDSRRSQRTDPQTLFKPISKISTKTLYYEAVQLFQVLFDTFLITITSKMTKK